MCVENVMFWFSIFIMTTIDNAAMQCESSERIEIRSSAVTAQSVAGEEKRSCTGQEFQLSST